MAKKGKKRSRQEPENIDLLCNVANYNETQESMEDCLAELEGTQQNKSSPLSAIDEPPPPESATQSVPLDSLWDSSISSTSFLNQKQMSVWNAAFRSYNKTRTYSDGLLPNVQLEISRHFQVNKLSSSLLDQCPELRMPAFERWWIDGKLEEKRMGDAKELDPVIPSQLLLETSLASQRLKQEIVDCCNKEVDEAETIVNNLCLASTRAAQELSSLSRRCASNPLHKARIDLEQSSSESTLVTLSYSRQKWKKPYLVKINQSHYEKLRDLFHRVHTDISLESPTNSRALRAFHVLLMVLLLRYSSLSGGQLLQDLRGGGMQGAIHPRVFSLLRQTFPTLSMECFASPFNAYLPNFASAFSDIDWHFGSVGDFWQFSFEEGCFQANPPFAPGFMMDMAERMQELLRLANLHQKSLSFVVIVPTVAANPRQGTDAAAAAKRFAQDSFRCMTSSPMCRMHVILPAREHGYVEGAQHLRPTRFKQSPYDTSVILLQSDRARGKKLDEDDFREQLRQAFASRHEEEMRSRQADGKDDDAKKQISIS